MSGKLQGREKPTANKWMCTCSDPDVMRSKGRAWHHGRCVRNRWATDPQVPLEPTAGARVQILPLPELGDKGGKWYIRKGAQWHAE